MKYISLILFLISNYSIAQDCSGVTKKTDKFNGQVTLSTPAGKKAGFYRIILESDTSYSVILSTGGPSANYGAHGVDILFENGDKINRSDLKVDCSYMGSGGLGYPYLFIATFRLSEEEIKKFITSKITDYRLGYEEGTIGSGLGETLIQQLKCMLKN